MESNHSEQFKSVRRTEKGASLVEYALLVALIAVIAIAGIRTLGQTVSNQFDSINTQMGG